jgi:hypothetical protein
VALDSQLGGLASAQHTDVAHKVDSVRRFADEVIGDDRNVTSQI